MAGDALRDSVYGSNPTLTKKQAAELAGLAGSFSAIFTGNATGLDDKEVAKNMHSGQRIGKNAAENNYFRGEAMDDHMSSAWLSGKISDEEYKGGVEIS